MQVPYLFQSKKHAFTSQGRILSFIIVEYYFIVNIYHFSVYSFIAGYFSCFYTLFGVNNAEENIWAYWISFRETEQAIGTKQKQPLSWCIKKVSKTEEKAEKKEQVGIYLVRVIFAL